MSAETDALLERLREQIKADEVGDFYRRMRAARLLWPGLTGNEQAAKNWGDIFEELEACLVSRSKN